MSEYQNKLWVTKEGEFGFGVQTFNTSNWSEKDFARIEWAHPSDRLLIAQALDAKRKKERQLTARIIERAESVEVRHFYIDEDGVVELDPDTGDEI